MKTLFASVFASVFALFLLAFTAIANAQEKIVIGQSVELSGEATGKENMEGALAYFAWVNAQGGVYGRKIELKSYDDKRKPETTKLNTEKLLKEDNALALFGYRSTPTVEAVLPLLLTNKVPMIAPFSGGQSLHQPFNPYLFNLRASYQDEAAKMIELFGTLGIRKVAILYQDDSFGKDGLAGFERNLAKHKLNAVATANYDRKDLKIDKAVDTIVAANPQAVLMACTPSVCSDFVKQVHKKGFHPTFMMLSNVSSDTFFESLGDDGRGVSVMQVMPYPKDFNAGATREFQSVLKGMPKPPPFSYSTFEGFVAAKLLTEGLRRAGPNPTRPKLVAALETLRDFDLGGVKVSYTPSNHDGSKFVEMIMIGKRGAILH
ncbi:ABC transporter substrate-binding protein [Collimonas sp.]|jgi:branched-chain amino acid transport system substrate-binding protein|uniref:ABC transporter substrate-binding protein n=1 Tax=Collimonas sp. TaxID=1963772 RepID=UPI002BA6F9D1|nr:ABC transporter substrate-binding protein [Collimonas sp.]HWW07733.1 ABC transporter substrate-binding protein [Collimonas sp.]